MIYSTNIYPLYNRLGTIPGTRDREVTGSQASPNRTFVMIINSVMVVRQVIRPEFCLSSRWRRKDRTPADHGLGRGQSRVLGGSIIYVSFKARKSFIPSSTPYQMLSTNPDKSLPSLNLFPPMQTASCRTYCVLWLDG